jgi:hypothetical protein
MSEDVDLSHVVAFPHTCHHETSRRGEAQPCEKPAVAVKLHEGEPFPVCAYHSYGQMVPLVALLDWGC